MGGFFSALTTKKQTENKCLNTKTRKVIDAVVNHTLLHAGILVVGGAVTIAAGVACTPAMAAVVATTVATIHAKAELMCEITLLFEMTQIAMEKNEGYEC